MGGQKSRRGSFLATATLGTLGVALAVGAGGLTISRTQTLAQGGCDPSYPDFCIPSAPPDIDCTELLPGQANFRALPPDPHEFDRNGDGIGCDDPAWPRYQIPALPYRLFAIMVACENCVPSPNTPTPVATSTPSSATSTATATVPASTATPTATVAQTCGNATASITGLNKGGSPEVVTVTGAGLMTGWYIISEAGNQRFDFPAGYVLNGSVQVQSGANATNNPPGILLWTTQNQWNNTSDDDAFLYDCTNASRGSFEDGQ